MGCFETKPRTISFDDGFFPEFQGKVLLVGVVMQGKETVENVVSSKISVDGEDSTEVIIGIVNSIPQKPACIFLDGLGFGGFNIPDLDRINRDTGLPVISVTDREPDLESIRKALENVGGFKKKWDKIKSAGPLFSHKKIFFHCKGLKEEKARELIDSTTKNSLPEGLRLAHMIASGVTRRIKLD